MTAMPHATIGADAMLETMEPIRSSVPSVRSVTVVRWTAASAVTAAAQTACSSPPAAPTALAIDATLSLRVSPRTALAVGLFTWLETAGSETRSPADGQRYLAKGKDVIPVVTPTYRMASDTQFFLGPYLGVQFGP